MAGTPPWCGFLRTWLETGVWTSILLHGALFLNFQFLCVEALVECDGLKCCSPVCLSPAQTCKHTCTRHPIWRFVPSANEITPSWSTNWW